MFEISKGAKCVLGGFLIHVVLGTVYIWGNITTYVTAHLRKFDEDLRYKDTLAVYACTLFFHGMFMPIGGKIETYIGARYTALLGGYIIVIGTFLSAAATDLVSIIIFDGVMLGIGIGISYSSPISSAIRWSPRYKTLYSGAIVSGFGIGALLFGFLSSIIVNPEGINIADTHPSDPMYYESHSSVPNRVPLMYTVFGVCYFVLVTSGACLIQDAPHHHEMIVSITSTKAGPSLPVAFNPVHIQHYRGADVTDTEAPSSASSTPSSTALASGADGLAVEGDLKKPYSYQRGGQDGTDSLFVTTEFRSDRLPSPSSSASPETAKPVSGGGASELVGSEEVDRAELEGEGQDLKRDLLPSELVRSSLAWQMALCLVLTAAPGMFLAGTYKTFGEAIFPQERFLSNVGSLSAIFNSAGRLGFGALAQWLGTLRTLQTVSLVFAVVVFTYPNSCALGQYGFAAWTFMLFACEGCNFALYPALNAQLFGTKYASLNYGLMFTLYALGTFVNITALSKLEVNFRDATIAIGLILCVGFLSLIIFEMRISSRERTR